ncbi:MAG: glutamate-cysteine ligase family protein [Thermoanaerobaculales bacterium]|jgi:glutamate--cysteine ligase|nr:glutamate-cysteine ligase family protein [Thermoanaerobaculales bacterium]
MPTRNRSDAVSVAQARRLAGLAAFPRVGAESAKTGVGLEPELFPIVSDASGAPRERLVLSRPNGLGVVQVIDGIAGADGPILPRIGRPPHAFFYPLTGGGRLTFEPGAQVEHSTTVHPSAAAALQDIEGTIGLLQSAFRPRSVRLAAVGLDVWHDVEEVPQQLRAGRYTAQAAYYRQRGHWGAVMMRHTASLQINLDLGPEGVWQERWLASNLISPFLTATFACSPGSGVVCARARAWQELDPTRSGFPGRLVTGAGDDPRTEWAEAALQADVMLIRASEEHFVPGCPGYRFVDWIENGHPRLGWPTVEDLDYHLTTLFFEIRARGFLELRAGEAVPDHVRPAQVVLASAVLYDEQARAEALSLLADYRTELPKLWSRAAAVGVHDDELRELACRLWTIALAGARRLPKGWVGDGNLAATEAFLEAYTAGGRVPADRLAELLEDDPARALAWASSEIV